MELQLSSSNILLACSGLGFFSFFFNIPEVVKSHFTKQKKKKPDQRQNTLSCSKNYGRKNSKKPVLRHLTSLETAFLWFIYHQKVIVLYQMLASVGGEAEHKEKMCSDSNFFYGSLQGLNYEAKSCTLSDKCIKA